MRTALLIPLASLAVAVAARDDESVARGKALFFDTQDLEYPSCAQCHSLLPEKEEQKKATHLGPGATLYGSVRREGWRNMNTYADLAAAIQPCAKKWQGRKRGLKAAQRADLMAFLETAAPKEGTLPKRKIRRPKLLASYDGGDKGKGKALVQRYCAGCHNESDESISFPFRPGKRKKAAIGRAIRGYDAKRKFKPKSMSYYTVERLSDRDLLHIVAYLGR